MTKNNDRKYVGENGWFEQGGMLWRPGMEKQLDEYIEHLQNPPKIKFKLRKLTVYVKEGSNDTTKI